MDNQYQPPMPPPAAPPPPPSFGAPPPGGGGGGPRLPWEDRATLGFVPALIETAKLIATNPRDAFGRLRPDGDYIAPMLFGGLIAWVCAIIGQIWGAVFSGIMGGMMGLGGGQLGAMAGGGLMQIIITAFIFPFIFVIVAFIGSGIYHLAVMVTGAAQDSPFGFEGTFKVVCYSQVAALGNVVPIVGALIALVAQVVLVMFGFQSAHRAPQGKAITAAVLPVAICCVCFILIMLLGGGLAFLGASQG